MKHLGKIALVTGSSRGIGRAIALKLASEGADVFVHYRSSQKGADEVAEEIRALGRRAWVVGGDVRKYEDIRALFEKIKAEVGRLDILINNAAMGSARPVLQMRPNQWDLTLEVCVRSVLQCSQQAAPLMQGWGRIVNLSSLGSHRYVPGYVAIGASKAAVESLTRSLAVELAELGINVNCVSGGMIETDTLDYLGDSVVDQKERYVKLCPKHRLGTPDDLAKVVSFLCSDDAEWIVGQTLIADGGYSVW